MVLPYRMVRDARGPQFGHKNAYDPESVSQQDQIVILPYMMSLTFVQILTINAMDI